MPSQRLPQISVGLPVYNGEAYLRTTIAALLGQTFRDFELVISDNCSTDATAEICRAFAEQDPRVKYYRNERNLGAATNFNRVVELAGGELFAWANHDDLWADTYLEKCAQAFRVSPDAVLAYARSALIDESGARLMPLKDRLALDDKRPVRRLRRFHDLFREIDRKGGWHDGEREGLWIPVYGLVRKALLQQTPLIGPYISSDTVLLEELLMLGRFVEIDDELFFKRDHEGRSMRASLPYDKRITWFTGKRSSRFLFPSWRLLWERMRAIARVQMPPREKLSCLAETLSFYLRRPYEWRGLVKDFWIILMSYLRPPPRAQLS
jgi:glycosyltransferase involved in cell wall biosynthesis